jgi:hypothetical protein
MAYVLSGSVRTIEAAVNASAEYTEWVRIDSRRSANVFTASLSDDSTTLSVTWVVQARRVKSDGTTGNTITIYNSGASSPGGMQTAQIAGVWEVRCGILTHSAGSGIASISW